MAAGIVRVSPEMLPSFTPDVTGKTPASGQAMLMSPVDPSGVSYAFYLNVKASGGVTSIDALLPGNVDLLSARTADDFDRTKIYDLVAAIAPNCATPKADFYRSLFVAMSNNKTSSSYDFSGLTRRDLNLAGKPFNACGLTISPGSHFANSAEDASVSNPTGVSGGPTLTITGPKA